MGAGLAHDTIRTTEPTSARAGDSLAWDYEDQDHLPSDGWSLFYFLYAAPSRHRVPATGAGDHFEVRQTSAETIGIIPGRDRFAHILEKSRDRYTEDLGELVVELDPTTNLLTHAEQMVSLVPCHSPSHATPRRRPPAPRAPSTHSLRPTT